MVTDTILNDTFTFSQTDSFQSPSLCYFNCAYVNLHRGVREDWSNLLGGQGYLDERHHTIKMSMVVITACWHPHAVTTSSAEGKDSEA